MKWSSLTYYLKHFFRLYTFKQIFFYIQMFFEDFIIAHGKIHKSDNSFIHPSVNFKCPENVYIGSHTRIQPNVCLWASPNSKITVGDYSGLGPQTMAFSSNHKYEFGKIYIEQDWVEKDITIGKNVWVGSGCIITAGVTIGDGSVVGAGSLINKDIPPNSLAVGIPVRIVKDGSKIETKE